MSTLSSDNSSFPTNNTNIDEFNKLFGAIPKIPEKVKEKPKKVPILQKKSYSVSTWVSEQNFQQISCSQDSVDRSELSGSPLPDSVHSCMGLQRSLEKRQKEILNSEAKNPEKRAKIDKTPVKPVQQSTRADRSSSTHTIIIARKSHENSKITVQQSALADHSTRIAPETQETLNNTNSTTKFDEVTSLFNQNDPTLFDAFSFHFLYKFDWERFQRGKMDYVVFTKLCEKHSEGDIIEMPKKKYYCTECRHGNLLTTIRLTVPLDLSEIPFPRGNDVEIHVSFLLKHFLEHPNFEKSKKEFEYYFTKEYIQRMYHYYLEMIKERKSNALYTEWFQKCKKFVKMGLETKSARINAGRVIRRKIEQKRGGVKKRCAVFVNIFELE